MLHLQCPKCGAEMEADNSYGGQQAACECGETFQLADAPEHGDFRLCLACVRLCENDAPRCPDCGFDFRRNRPGKTPRQDSGNTPGFYRRNCGRINKLALLVLLAAIGFLIYSHYSASPIGLSSAAPLGVIGKDLTYNGQTFTRIANEFPEPFRQFNAYCFRNDKKARETRGMIDETIIILAGDDGKVQAITGNFVVPSAAFAPGGTNGKNFFDRLDREFKNPQELPYKVTTRTDGFLKITEENAAIDDAGRKMRHRRIQNPSGIIESQHTVRYTLAQYDPDRLALAFRLNPDGEDEDAP